MTIHLLNSAMMPNDGVYTLRTVSVEQWREEFNAALNKGGVVKSSIGYPQTASHISAVLGIDAPVSQEQTSLAAGDIGMVCKLPYRVSDPATKGSPVEGEFVYSIVTYLGDI